MSRLSDRLSLLSAQPIEEEPEQPVEQPVESSGFLGNIAGGLKQSAIMGTGLGAELKQEGYDELGDWLIEKTAPLVEESGQYSGASFRGSNMDQAAFALGSQVPQALPAILSGVGAGLATRNPSAAYGAGIAGGAASTYLSSRGELELEKRRAMEDAAIIEGLDNQVASGQMTPEQRQQKIEEFNLRPYAAAAAAPDLAQMVADVGIGALATAVLGSYKPLAGVAAPFLRTAGRRVATGAVIGGASGAGTGYVAEPFVERFQERVNLLSREEYDPGAVTQQEAEQRIYEAGESAKIPGLVAGGLFGAVGGATSPISIPIDEQARPEEISLGRESMDQGASAQDERGLQPPPTQTPQARAAEVVTEQQSQDRDSQQRTGEREVQGEVLERRVNRPQEPVAEPETDRTQVQDIPVSTPRQDEQDQSVETQTQEPQTQEVQEQPTEALADPVAEVWPAIARRSRVQPAPASVDNRRPQAEPPQQQSRDERSSAEQREEPQAPQLVPETRSVPSVEEPSPSDRRQSAEPQQDQQSPTQTSQPEVPDTSPTSVEPQRKNTQTEPQTGQQPEQTTQAPTTENGERQGKISRTEASLKPRILASYGRGRNPVLVKEQDIKFAQANPDRFKLRKTKKGYSITSYRDPETNETYSKANPVPTTEAAPTPPVSPSVTPDSTTTTETQTSVQTPAPEPVKAKTPQVETPQVETQQNFPKEVNGRRTVQPGELISRREFNKRVETNEGFDSVSEARELRNVISNKINAPEDDFVSVQVDGSTQYAATPMVSNEVTFNGTLEQLRKQIKGTAFKGNYNSVKNSVKNAPVERVLVTANNGKQYKFYAPYGSFNQDGATVFNQEPTTQEPTTQEPATQEPTTDPNAARMARGTVRAAAPEPRKRTTKPKKAKKPQVEEPTQEISPEMRSAQRLKRGKVGTYALEGVTNPSIEQVEAYLKHDFISGISTFTKRNAKGEILSGARIYDYDPKTKTIFLLTPNKIRLDIEKQSLQAFYDSGFTFDAELTRRLDNADIEAVKNYTVEKLSNPEFIKARQNRLDPTISVEDLQRRAQLRQERSYVAEYADTSVPREQRPRLSTSQVQGAIRKRFGDIPVTVVDTPEQLPAKIKNEHKNYQDMAGAYDYGEIYIIASNVTDETVAGTVVHEGLHSLVDQARINNPDVQTAIDAFGSEEAAAYALQNYEEATPYVRKLVANLVAAVRAAMRKVFGKQFTRVSEADMRYAVLKHLRYGGTARPAYKISMPSFVGMRAAKYFNTPYQQFKALQKQGLDEQQLVEQTGWFVGPDGKERFWLSDDVSVFHPRSLSTLTSRSLDQVLDHPNLFQIYPELRNIQVSRDGNPNNQGARLISLIKPGTMERDAINSEIILGDGTLKAGGARVLLHEVQHLIQLIEGHSAGTNMRDAYAIKLLKDKETVAKLQRNLASDDKFMDVVRQEMLDALDVDITQIDFDLFDAAVIRFLDTYGRVEGGVDLSTIDLAAEISLGKETYVTVGDMVDAYTASLSNMNASTDPAVRVQAVPYQTLLYGHKKLYDTSFTVARDSFLRYAESVGEREARSTQALYRNEIDRAKPVTDILVRPPSFEDTNVSVDDQMLELYTSEMEFLGSPPAPPTPPRPTPSEPGRVATVKSVAKHFSHKLEDATRYTFNLINSRGYLFKNPNAPRTNYIRTLYDTQRKQDALRARMAARTFKIVQRYRKLNAQQRQKLSEFATDASVLQLYGNPNKQQEWNELEWNAQFVNEDAGLGFNSMSEAVADLQARYAQFTAKEKAIYEDLVADMGRYKDERVAVAIARVNDTFGKNTQAARKYRQELKDSVKKIRGPYVPLKRFGEHVVQVFNTAGGKRLERHHFESPKDAERFMQQQRDAGRHVEYDIIDNFEKEFSKVSPALYQKLQADITANIQDPNEQARALKVIAEAYYSLLPESHLLHHSRARTALPGYIRNDVDRVYLNYATQSAKQIAHARYDHDINNIFNAMREYNTVDEVRGRGLILELRQRYSNAYSMEMPTWASVANQLTYGWLLSGPSTAILQQFQPWMISVPVMLSKFKGNPLTLMSRMFANQGRALNPEYYENKILDDPQFNQVYNRIFGRITSNAEAEASRLAGNPNAELFGFKLSNTAINQQIQNLDAKTKRKLALRQAYEEGLISLSLSQEIFNEIAQTNKFTRGLGKTTHALLKMLELSERHSRASVFMTAFDTALQENNNQFMKAYKEASNIVDGTLYNYSMSNRPSVLQKPSTRILTQITSYKLHTLNLLYSAIRQKSGYNGVKALAYMHGLSALFAGVAETPLGALGLLLLNFWENIDGDDDDPVDLKEEFKNFLKETGGPFGEVLAGGIGRAAGFDFSQNIGFSGVVGTMYSGNSVITDYKSEFHKLVMYLLGPTVSGTGDQLARAVDELINKRDYAEALQYASPALIRRLVEAGRIGYTGVLDRANRTIIPKENLTVWDQVGTALGVQTNKRKDETTAHYLSLTTQRKEQARKREIVDMYLRGDKLEGRKARRVYNRTHRHNPLTYGQIRAARRRLKDKANYYKER